MAANIDGVLHGQNTYSTGLNPNPGLDIRIGGQHGRLPAIGGRDLFGTFEEWQSNKAYVKRNIFLKLVEYPKAFDYFENTSLLIGTLQSLIERHFITVDGYNSKLTVNFAEHAVGNSQEVQAEVVNVVREASSISATVQELEGRPIQRFIEFVIKYLYMDPDLKYPRITSFLPDEFSKSKLYLPEMNTFTVMAIEPDILMRKPINAWLSVNMMFRDGGDAIGRKNQANEGDLVEHSLSFTSITLNNEIILGMAAEMLDKMAINTLLFEDSVIPPVEGINEKLDNDNTVWEKYKNQ